MDRILARGGNHRLNVGPQADGTFGEPFTVTLAPTGE
jgi:hypothetical protein